MESCFIPIQVQSSHGFRKTGPKKKKKSTSKYKEGEQFNKRII